LRLDSGGFAGCADYAGWRVLVARKEDDSCEKSHFGVRCGNIVLGILHLRAGKGIRMADMINLDQKLEVRDPSGKTVGFLLSESTFRELMAEQDCMRQELARLRQIQEELEKERGEYQMSCSALGEMYLAAMEMVDPKALERRTTSFDLLIQELDKVAEAHSRRNLDGN
jgi:hypothetical protein